MAHGNVRITTGFRSDSDVDRFETSAAWTDVTFSVAYRDLTITFPDGDEVVIDEQEAGNEARRVQTFVFDGVTYTADDVRARADSGG